MTTPTQYERATCMLSPVSYSDETQLFYCVPSRFDNIADTDEDAALADLGVHAQREGRVAQDEPDEKAEAARALHSLGL